MALILVATPMLPELVLLVPQAADDPIFPLKPCWLILTFCCHAYAAC